MALFKDQINLGYSDNVAFDAWHSPGDIVEYSGIYKCHCGKHEAACNENDPFPPHYPHCGNIKWRLIVAVQYYPDSPPPSEFL